MQPPAGARRQGARPAEAEVDRRLAAEDRAQRRRARRSCSRRRRRPRPAADPALLAGRPGAVHHAAGRDHARPARRARATSACTGCRRSTGARRCMHWQIHKDGRADYLATDGRLEVAVALGLDPVTAYSASAPLPKHIDEFMLAGFLRGEPVELVAGEDGRPRGARRTRRSCSRATSRRASSALEGPFGDHTGYYTAAEPFPVFHVTAMTMRRDAIYPSIVVGKPPQEDAWLGKATERIFLPAIRMTRARDRRLRPAGRRRVPQLRASSRSARRFPGHAQKVMHAIWGLGMLVADEGGRRRRRVRRRPRLRGGLLPRLRERRPEARRRCSREGPLDHLDHAPTLPVLRRQARHRRDRTRAPAEGTRRVAAGDRDERRGPRARRPPLGGVRHRRSIRARQRRDRAARCDSCYVVDSR